MEIQFVGFYFTLMRSPIIQCSFDTIIMSQEDMKIEDEALVMIDYIEQPILQCDDSDFVF